MDNQIQDERRNFQEARMIQESEKLAFGENVEKKLFELQRQQVRDRHAPNHPSGRTQVIRTIEEYKNLATNRENNKKRFIETMENTRKRLQKAK